MSKTEVVRKNFLEAKAVLDAVLSNEKLLNDISSAAGLMVASVKGGGKIISCGNGGSMCDAMQRPGYGCGL